MDEKSRGPAEKKLPGDLSSDEHVTGTENPRIVLWLILLYALGLALLVIEDIISHSFI